MSPLHQAAQDYLALRRAMGFKLYAAGLLLPRFIDFLEHQQATVITTELAVLWATQPEQVQPAEWTRRLSIVRGFARHYSGIDPRTEIPPTQLLAYRRHRCSPYLYSDAQIAQLLEAAHHLPSPSGLRACTYATAFALLAVTGMRVGELVALDNDDLDLTRGLLTIRHAKFDKSRCLPLHATTQQALGKYLQQRDSHYPISSTPSFFLSETGTRLTVNTVERTFVKVSRQIGLRAPADSHGPRLHDLRHRFAVQTLLRWYRQGEDVQQHLPELSTYLGHVKVSDTYWYLSAVPELLHLAMQRLESNPERGPL